MFIDLNNILDIDEKQPPDRISISISSSQTDNGFLIHHFLSLYIRNGYNVCMVSFTQSFSHYNNVGQKLGVNITAARDNGTLIFIDGLKLINECLFASPGDSGGVEKNPFSFVSDPKPDLKNLYDHIKQTITSFSSHSTVPTLLLMDDLGILTDLGVPVLAVGDLMMYLRNFMTSAQTLRSGCLVSVVQADKDAADEEHELLLTRLAHNSDMMLHCKSLNSGYCKDVHGELLVTWLDPKQNYPFTSRAKRMQFKIMDKTVSFFAAGMSSAVL
ncbi:elongator complex protein 6 [Lingula anatina]|uniref:Elongator complex protein 6 n=1 Tax=Lingula anatina TaxID=7574 RepID=A0A1S3HHQ9_LINAN|nr:elongator complex protein 6 [Lingula anatina]|eukprot:XP_013385640.1 elongator complex protein 6 [Lingula anatina]